MENILNFRIIIVVFIVGWCFPNSIVHAEIEKTVLQEHIPGWTLHHEHLDIFRFALTTRRDEKEYAYCIGKNPYVQGNIKIKEWTFSWNDTNYTMYANHTFFETMTEGENLVHDSIDYTIYTEESDVFLIEALYISHHDGSDSQFVIMAQEDNSLAIEGINGTDQFVHTFELSAPYSLTGDAIYAVTDEQQLQWVEFNAETLTIEVKHANAIREGHLVILRYLDELGPEVIYNEEHDMSTRMIVRGLSWALCERLVDAPIPTPLSIKDTKQRILKQAIEMYSAFSQKRYDEFLAYFPLELISQLGGLQKTIQLISQDPLKGAIVTRDIVNVSDIVEEEHGLAAFVTVTTIYDFDGQEYLQQTYMIALSEDQGHRWVFYSSQGQPEQETHYKAMFPRLTETFSYPETFLTKK